MVELNEKICSDLLNNSLEEFAKCLFLNADDVLNQTFEHSNGIVYKFYIENGNYFDLKYIGKSTGKYFKTRLRAHFKNIGVGTQSKNSRIVAEQTKGNRVLIKYIETKPIFLRNLIEEMLIEYYCKINKLEMWNYKN